MFTVAFILSTRRAGSTWLNAVLGSHAQAAGLGEYFRPFEMPGHVACRLCEADGLSACSKLHGIETVELEDAYAFAAQRLGKRVLIDCSKQLHWPEYFMYQRKIDARFIHLVRHPCGYVESELRRRPAESAETIAAEWAMQNRNIETFIRDSGRPGYLASYDLLADFPEIYFPGLCRFLGLAYDPDALRYWEFEHHGLGGNGANSLYLRDRTVKEYVTGDDAYYDGLEARPLSADVRWQQRLTAREIAVATASDYAKEMALRLAVSW
jgi:hypothetical protein